MQTLDSLPELEDLAEVELPSPVIIALARRLHVYRRNADRDQQLERIASCFRNNGMMAEVEEHFGGRPLVDPEALLDKIEQYIDEIGPATIMRMVHRLKNQRARKSS